MKTPIVHLMDKVEWKEVSRPSVRSKLPFATHEGILHIFDFDFKVYTLNDGQRIIDADDVKMFLDNLPRPTKS